MIPTHIYKILFLLFLVGFQINDVRAESQTPIWVGCDKNLPERICTRFKESLPGEPFRFTEHKRVAKLLLTLHRPAKSIELGHWFLAQVIPFKSAHEGLSLLAIKAIWRGQKHRKGGWLWTTEESYSLLKTHWGTPSRLVRKLGLGKFTEKMEKRGNRGVISFDQLQPQWKVTQLAKKSLFVHGSERVLKHYPLRFPIYLTDRNCESCLEKARQTFSRISNRNSEELTVVMLTGVSALSLGVAQLIETRGTSYPVSNLRQVFKGSDFIHVSNEASFQPTCDSEDSMPYCSRDFYLEVFRHLGINIIEMTGSHLMTHGARWFEHSLKLFKNHSMQWYGGGSTRGKASAPLLLNKNANKIALLGCNARPPEEAIAKGRKPGISECNEDALLHQIKKLKSEGYAVIITVKSPGKAVSKPPRLQKALFRKLSSSGADAVVGTQGSQPRAMEFYKGGFIHYGLGNFLYDGMESVDIRHQVYDRLIFYGGRLLSIELETAILEEHGRPRTTTKKERKSFLKKLFKVRF